MRYFYYVHTGHRIGLDRFHRAIAIVTELQKEIDITLLCSDFRIAAEAKEFGIKRSVGVDLVRNIPQIAQNGDKIIFDSAEINPTLLDDMTLFFSSFIRISDDPSDTKHAKEFLISPYLVGEGICTATVINERYFESLPKTIPLALFFGDDDYEKDLEKNQALFKPLEAELLMGFYHFLGYENALKESFKTIHECEEYDEIIRKSEILVSGSPQAVLQNLAGGGKPIYLQRPDYVRDFIPLFDTLSIPIVEGFSQEQLMQRVKTVVSNNYHTIEKSNTKVIEFIRKTFIL
ncbi:MAG: hypothetical protein PHW18_00260 [Sulfuricurvum sp.]|uniref:hypothetical protein n=1 Tax=Sulfuricurvum sp. TaxID=2025608 RepID=UPI002634DF3E|nr:hypothetical protein [Sulfuricurvum sp.]MDD2827987.1 hypothetical protein [Sulfuricurvum sp.]MDD4948136.1 hypothetical protein [Sulfuricurvum sp.]